MASPIRTAVALAKAALAAVDWVTECSEPVEVSSSPERQFAQKDIEEKCIIHIAGGPIVRNAVIRGILPLIRKPQIVVSVWRYIPPDEAGLVDEQLLARCEGVADKACEVVCQAIYDSGVYGLAGPVDQPEEYQLDLLRQGTYLTAMFIPLQMGGGA